MAKLVVISEGFTGKTVELKADKITIGRSEDNSFQIAENSVSSRHCELQLKDDILHIKDLGSTNGTFINDKKILRKNEPLSSLIRSFIRSYHGKE